MVKEFIESWEKNKHKIEKHLKENEIRTYDSYKELFELLLQYVINDEIEYGKFGNVTVLNDGDYQGTYIFIANREYYQPSESDYISTFVSYGSCSGCDTLQSIIYDITNYDNGLASESQVEDFMTLILHMLQRCKYIFKED